MNQIPSENKRTPSDAQTQINWDKDSHEKFRRMVKKIPIFLRGIAQDKVSKEAEKIVRKENRQEVCEKDMVDAFFAATPFGFHGPMKCDMEEIGIDYQKYGYKR